MLVENSVIEMSKGDRHVVLAVRNYNHQIVAFVQSMEDGLFRFAVEKLVGKQLVLEFVNNEEERMKLAHYFDSTR